MNAERLHYLASKLVKEFQAKQIIKLLSNLINQLQNLVNSPNDAGAQQNLHNARSTLADRLKSIEIDHLSPTFRKMVVDLGLSYFFGDALSKTVDAIFERNQITPAVALTEITSIRDKLQEHLNHLQQLSAALVHFDIEEDNLRFGAAEVSVFIPREAVQNELANFGVEIRKLDQILKVFYEFSTGETERIKINQISSSDLSLFLDLAPQVAAFLAVALERIVALYKNVLDIRIQHNQLKNLNVPEETLKGIEDHANKVMEDGVKGHVDEIFDANPPEVEEGRRKELKTAVVKALLELAYRIDEGYNVDVRAGAPESAESDDETDEVKAQRAYAIKINTAAANIRFVKPPGDPILLPKQNDSDDRP